MRDRQSRREFMGLAAAGAGALLVPPKLDTTHPLFAETFASARARRMPTSSCSTRRSTRWIRRMPRAEAFAMNGGRFVAVGSTADIRGLIGKGTQTFDAKQMTIVPGFIDCHNHAGGTTLLYEVLVGNPFEVEFVTIAEHHRQAAGEGAADAAGHVGRGLLPRRHEAQGQAPAQRHDLDQVSTEHPVVVQHRGGHTSFYNSKALELAGITKDTPNPPGGTFDRDANGELNGRVTDRARNAVSRVGKRPSFTPEQTAQRDRDGIAHISKQFVRYGLTSVHHEGGDLAAIQDVRARGDLHHRVSYEASGRVLDSMIAERHHDRLRRRVDQVRRDVGAHRRRLVLRAHDGAEHAVPGRQPPYKGNVTETQDDLNAWVENACIARAFR